MPFKETTYKFNYRGQQLIGQGSPIWNESNKYENVLCLRLQDETSDLPSSIVLKIEDPEGDFGNEKAVYDKLQSLQGQNIPVCYGAALIDNRRALVLSHIHGVPLLDRSVLLIPDETLKKQLIQLYRSISVEGILCTDATANNVLYSEGKFVAVDFEHAKIQQPTDDHTLFIVENLMRMIWMRRHSLQPKPQKAKWISTKNLNLLTNVFS